MLLVGYCLGIRSERRLCEEVHLNLAYRWFSRLDLADRVPDHLTFSKNRHGRFRDSDLLRHLFETTVARCMAEGVAPHIPVIDQTKLVKGIWSRDAFEWDPENNRYICPEGHDLKQFRRNYSDPNRGPTGKGTARFRALKLTCQTCPSKLQGCPDGDARTINPEPNEDARQVAHDIVQDKAICRLNAAQKESQNALRSPQTHPRAGAASTAKAMRRK